MMVQQNRNAIVSTLFLNKSPTLITLLSIFLYKLLDYNPLFSLYTYIYKENNG